MSLREADIRPADLLAEYLRLNEEDGKVLLTNSSEMESRACPGCGEDDPIPAFDKNGFKLVRCNACQSLYVDPVPSDGALADFYRDSPSADYWANVFFPAVAEARRGAIYAPRAARVAAIAAEHQTPVGRLVDVGAGAGLFLEEFHRLCPNAEVAAVEPGTVHVGELRGKGFEVFAGFADDSAGDPAWAGSADIVTCFEVLEHVPDPMALLSGLARLARPGGLILVSGLCGGGFDIQVLEARSKAVSPPHHLTFLSTDGAARLVQRCGLENLGITTPGELDVDIVRGAALEHPDGLDDPFLRHLILDAPDAARTGFQEFLKAQGLSSHMWIIARR